MGIEQKRLEVIGHCKAVIRDLSEPELDAVLRDPEYFRALFRYRLGMSQSAGRPSDPEDPYFQARLRESLGCNSRRIGR